MRWLPLTLLVACSGDDDALTEPSEPTSDTGGAELVLARADAGPDRVVSVGAQVSFDDLSEGVSFLWDMGDGTQLSDPAPTHAWSEPGTYTVVVRATGEDGGTDADSAKVVVRTGIAEVAAVGSSTVVVADGWLYVVEPDAGTLLRTDGTEHQRVVACDHPRTVAVDGDTVAVACEGSGSVAFFSSSDLGFVAEASLGLGARPYGVVSGGEGRFWVSDTGRRLRSSRVTPKASSRFLRCCEAADWVIPSAAAAAVTCRISVTAMKTSMARNRLMSISLRVLPICAPIACPGPVTGA